MNSIFGLESILTEMADQDRGKGFSLRKRHDRRQGHKDPRELRDGRADRNQLPPPRRSHESRTSNDTSASEPRPRPRQRVNDATSNLVKKRYSVRYNQAPDFSQGLPPLPGVPKIPQSYGQLDRRGADDPRGAQGIDVRALRDPNFKADQCWYFYHSLREDLH